MQFEIFNIFTVFKTVEFPAGIPNLAASLANMNRNTLSLKNIFLKYWSVNQRIVTIFNRVNHE